MTEISREASQKISFWAFVFTVVVVATHCSWGSASTADRILSLLVQGTLSRLCVPFFFVVSGFMLARHFEEDGWWRREALKRVRSLGVPYVLWTVILATTLWLETGEIMGVGGFGLNPCKLPALAPLWYVRCFMLFILTLPVLKALLDRGKKRLLVGLYLALWAISAIWVLRGWTDEGGIGGFLTYCYSPEGLFYFLSGVYFQRYRAPAVSWKTSVLLTVAGTLMLVIKLALYLRGQPVGVNLNLAITPLLLAGLWGIVPPISLPSFLSGCSFPMYLMHGIVLSVLRNSSGTYRLCNLWLELVLGISIPILFYRFVHRYFRRLSFLFFGGR